MIRRVNESASDFRKASDAQVAPTIKRALRENQQVKVALRKLETTRGDIDEQTREYADRLENAILKQKSLADTEIDLAHQSHAKAVIITQLEKKIKEANAELSTLELRELEIEKKSEIMESLKQEQDDQKQGNVWENCPSKCNIKIWSKIDSANQARKITMKFFRN